MTQECNDSVAQPDIQPGTEKLTLLLLDDEKDILNALKRLLRKNYNIVNFTQGSEAKNTLKTTQST